jgi:hypothetical protein
MKSTEDNTGRGRLVPADESPSDRQDEVTGLPGLRTWNNVYLFVFACFVLWVSLLLVLTVLYS